MPVGIPENTSYEDGALTLGRRHAAVTPHDSTNFTEMPKAVFVGVAGNVVAVDEYGTAVTYAMAAGQILPIRPIRINSTNTTATGLVAIYGPTGRT
jgi:hypothetical protein